VAASWTTASCTSVFPTFLVPSPQPSPQPSGTLHADRYACVRSTHLLLQLQHILSSDRTCSAAAKASLSRRPRQAAPPALQPQIQTITDARNLKPLQTIPQTSTTPPAAVQLFSSIWTHVTPCSSAMLLRRPHSPPAPGQSWPAAPPARQPQTQPTTEAPSSSLVDED
jgi:hypothetical protein